MWQNKAVTKVIKILLAESAAWQWLRVLLLDALETDAVDLLMTEAATAAHLRPKVRFLNILEIKKHFCI